MKLRLEREQPLTFLEFNYMLLQAYDFLEFARRYDCKLQMGGSDQWGNIVNGVELGRRVDQRTLYGLTTPLITTASGAKMGKTATGAVWLTLKGARRTSTGSFRGMSRTPISAASDYSPSSRSMRFAGWRLSKAPIGTKQKKS